MNWYSVPATIAVSFRVEGWHHWPGAPEHRAYLANDHRHMFHVRASVGVTADNREIEFHDLLDFCRANFPGGQMGGRSCEMMARDLAAEITRAYRRSATVTVSEDGEVEATVATFRWQPGVKPPEGWQLVEEGDQGGEPVGQEGQNARQHREGNRDGE